jgi:hypothetical protein
MKAIPHEVFLCNIRHRRRVLISMPTVPILVGWRFEIGAITCKASKDTHSFTDKDSIRPAKMRPRRELQVSTELASSVLEGHFLRVVVNAIKDEE